jgi:lysophospholipase L1-like esterase
MHVHSHLASSIASHIRQHIETDDDPPPFDPSSLFGASDRGVVFDFGDETTLFQASAGTGAVSAENDPIGFATDLGSNAKNATQATAANRPLWRGGPRTLGSELLTNGRLSADTDWTKGTGWTISAPVATKVAGSATGLSQNVTVVAGRTYQLCYTMTRSAGSLTPRVTGGTTVSMTARSAGGTYLEVFMAVTGNVTFEFLADATFAGTVKSITLKEVTSSVNKGAYVFGSPQRIVTSAINFSNSDKMTVIYSNLFDQAIASTTLCAIGNWATTNGTIWTGYGTNPVGRIRGDTSSGSITLAAPDTLVGAGGASYVDMHEFDLAQTALADEITVTTVGVERSGTASGSAGGGGNWNSSITVDLGVASFRGIINRIIVINRLLTVDEKADALAWVKEGHVFGATLGDSTIAGLSGAIPIASRASSFCPGLVCGRYELAESGRRIADMLTFWNALPEYSTLDCVFIQIGLNDIKGRIGENLATTATVLSDLQGLVDQVRSDVSANCKIYICGLTPCKAWLDTATNPTAANTAWTDINAAIAGSGGSPITNVDGRITSHVASLNDGSGNLQAIYDYNSDGVHGSNEARWIIAQAWRTKLEEDGLV